jgi:hypothetical protein
MLLLAGSHKRARPGNLPKSSISSEIREVWREEHFYFFRFFEHFISKTV